MSGRYAAKFSNVLQLRCQTASNASRISALAVRSPAETDAEAKIGAHYRTCVSRAKITNSQLAERTLVFGAARTSLQSVGVGTVMINYLLQLCRKPPQVK